MHIRCAFASLPCLFVADLPIDESFWLSSSDSSTSEFEEELEEERFEHNTDEVNEIRSESDHETLPHRRGRPTKPLPNLDIPIRENARTTSKKLMISIMQLQTQFRVPLACLKHIVNIIREALPSNHQVPEYEEGRRAVISSRLPPAKVVDVCQNHCIAFVDLEFVKNYKYSNSTFCPICHHPRWNEKNNLIW